MPIGYMHAYYKDMRACTYYIHIRIMCQYLQAHAHRAYVYSEIGNSFGYLPAAIIHVRTLRIYMYACIHE